MAGVALTIAFKMKLLQKKYEKIRFISDAVDFPRIKRQPALNSRVIKYRKTENKIRLEVNITERTLIFIRRSFKPMEWKCIKRFNYA